MSPWLATVSMDSWLLRDSMTTSRDRLGNDLILGGREEGEAGKALGGGSEIYGGGISALRRRLLRWGRTERHATAALPIPDDFSAFPRTRWRPRCHSLPRPQVWGPLHAFQPSRPAVEAVDAPFRLSPTLPPSFSIQLSHTPIATRAEQSPAVAAPAPACTSPSKPSPEHRACAPSSAPAGS